MFGWLFGKKKKVNTRNRTKTNMLREEIKMYSQKQKVQALRRLKGIHPYDVDFDIMYADDQLEDVLMLYILMGMIDVIEEEEMGFYEVEDAVIEAEVCPEGTVGEEVISDLEETPEIESTDDIVAEVVAEVPSIFAEGGTLDMTKIDEEIAEEPTPIVEEIVVEQAPVIEPAPVVETPSFAEKTETFADDFKTEDTSSSFGDSFGSSDSGSSYDSGDSGGGSDD